MISHKIYLPALYWYDHTDNGCDGGELIKEAGNRVKVLVSDADIKEIVSRASYYVSFVGEDFNENRSLCNSARNTLLAITKHLQSQSV